MAYLDDFPPARSQFRCPRREEPSGVVVVHTAESTPDFVAIDAGAESVANFIRNRTDPGSYHDLVDSDSIVQLVRYECEAFHDATGSNPHSYGVSAATRADLWSMAPEAWRTACVNNMAAAAARYARWLKARRGIVIPARRITRNESEMRLPGFIAHADRDPARRTDPGVGFPWAAFLAEFARLTTPKRSKTVDLVNHPGDKRVDQFYVRNGKCQHVWAMNAWMLITQPPDKRNQPDGWGTEDLGGENIISVAAAWEHDGDDVGLVVVAEITTGQIYTRAWYPNTGEWEPWRDQPGT